MQRPPLLFDYQSTTPCSTKVLKAMEPYWKEFYGNPSNKQNQAGLYASAAVGVARESIASYLGVRPERLVFTSGATESNNLALLGHARAKALQTGSPGHLITISSEHKAVLDPIRQLKKEGFRVTELSPDSNGMICLDQLHDAIQADTFLISVMAANNEIGVLQPLKEISVLCNKYKLTLHSDASQAFGYIPINVDKLGIDLMSISGHKIYGPKGIGILIIKDNIPIKPLQWGGDQEQFIRPGTLPVPLIIGISKAIEIAAEKMHIYSQKSRDLRDQLWDGLNKEIPDLLINGSLEKRLNHNINFTVLGLNGNRMHKELRDLIVCSSGSACANGEASHVLLSIGRTNKEAESSLRLSVGRATTLQDVNRAINIISKVVKELRG